MSLLIIRPIIAVLAVHGFTLFAAILFSNLEFESNDNPLSPTHAFLEAAFRNGSLDIADQNASSPAFRQFVEAYEAAYKQEVNQNMSTAFGDLTKAYFFSLTTVSTVGNSGMFLQKNSSKNFYIICIMAGVVLYITALHHIAVLLLPVLKYACQTQNNKNQLTGEYSRAAVMAFGYGMLFISILLLGVSAVFAGHTYVFGLYASFDNVLTIGNIKWFTYLLPWNKEAFVVGLDLFMFLGHSLLYTAVYITIHFIKTDNILKRVGQWACFGDLWHGYEPIGQNEPDVTHRVTETSSENLNNDVSIGSPEQIPSLDKESDLPTTSLPKFVIEDVDNPQR